MTWVWFRKWLEYKKRKVLSRHKKVAMDESQSRVDTLSTLDQLPTMYVKEYGYIPLVLVNAASVIEKNIRTKGLFQTKGDNSKITEELLTRPRNSKLKSVNVHDAVETMKTFLVNLPSPALPEQVCDSLIKASEKDSMSQYVFALREFRNMSPYNFAILHFVMRLLKKVSEYSEHNCMDVRNLATIFALDIMRPMKQEDLSYGPFMAEPVQRLPFLITVVENLIQNVNMFKMVCSLDEATSRTLDRYSSRAFVTSQPAKSSEATTSYNTGFQNQEIDLWTPSNCKMTEEFRAYSVDLENISKSQKRQSCTLDTSAVAASFSNMEIRVCSNSLENRDVSADSITSEENHFRLKNVVLEPEDRMLSNVSMCIGIQEINSVKKKQKKQLITDVTNMKNSQNRRKIKKMNKSQTSPDKKPLLSTSRKYSSGTMKKRKGKRCNGKKLNTVQVDGNFSCCTDLSVLNLNEEIVSWCSKSSDIDDLSSVTRVVRSPKILPSKSSVARKQKEVVDMETMTISNNSDESQAVLASKEGNMSVNRREDVLTANPNSNSTEAEWNDSPSQHIQMTLSTHGESSKMPEICVKYSSHKNTLYSNPRIRDNKVNDNTEVNVNPCLNISLTSANRQVNQRVSERSKETSFLKINASVDDWKLQSQLNVPKSGKNTEKSHSTNAAQNDIHIKDSTRGSVSECNNIREFPEANLTSQEVGAAASDNNCDSVTRAHQEGQLILTRNKWGIRTPSEHHQTICLTMRNERIKTPPRFRHQRSYNRTYSSAESHSEQVRSEQHTLGKWFLDICLVGLMTFSICLLLHILRFNRTDEEGHD